MSGSDHLLTVTPLGLERVVRTDAAALRAALLERHSACGCAGEAGCFTAELDRLGAETVARRPPGGSWSVRGSESEPFRPGEPPAWLNTLLPLRVTL